MKPIATALLCTLSLGLAHCATPQAPGERPAFPAREKSYLPEGALVAPDTVRRVQPGLTRDQVRLALGNPHFSEGLLEGPFPRTWNYLLQRPADGAATPEPCAFQVQFDTQRLVQAVHWQREECAQWVAPVATLAAAPAPVVETLSEPDLRFAFGRSGLADLDADSRTRLAQLAQRVSERAAAVLSIHIAGYADRLGDTETNYGLSLARAYTVADAFTQRGVPAEVIQVVGKGAFETAAECQRNTARAPLIQCLAPDRRVTVTVRLTQP